MQTIRVGVIGLGFMGVTHLRAYQKMPNVRIAGLCAARQLPVDGVLAAPGGNLGGDDSLSFDMSHVMATRRPADLWDHPDIDVIDICTPTLTHPELAIAAMAAGKHVICEKPLARHSADARRIADAAANAKGYFMPAMCIRFWPEYQWLKQAIDDARFGRVLAARFRRVAEPPTWGREHFFDGAKSGGALLDLHIHDVDFIQHCFGRPHAVFAQGFSRHSGEIDHVTAQYQVNSGAVVSAEGGWSMSEGFGFEMAFTVIFENATADFLSTRGPDALKVFENGHPPSVIAADPGGDAYLTELTYFIDCITRHEAPSIVTAADAAQAVEICEAEGESIRSGQRVEL